MEQEYRNKILPADLCWTILNNLECFNKKPALIQTLYDKIKYQEEHPILGMFIGYFGEALKLHEKLNKFPDMQYLAVQYRDSNPVKFTDFAYSPIIYENFIKYVEQENLRRKTAEEFINNPIPDIKKIRQLSKELSKFADTSEEQKPLDKKALKNMYREYSKDYKGVKTYIGPLDEGVGMLGYKSIATIAAPSSSGKSTIARTIMYNAAIYGGLCVDYIAYEQPKEQLWFDLYSIESDILNINIESSKMKEATLSEDEVINLDKCADSLFNKLNKSGGYMNVVGQDEASVETFEALCNKLESIAEERGRGADIIIIDNVDNLAILKNSERDNTTRVNNYIIQLDSFCKTYYNNKGTLIILLSQVNRTSLKKFQDVEKGGNDNKVQIDYTAVQQFNSIYEKSTVLLCIYSDKKMRSIDRMNVYPVKLRNRPVPLDPIKLPCRYGFSHVGGLLEEPSIDEVEELSATDLDNDLINMCEDEDLDEEAPWD